VFLILFCRQAEGCLSQAVLGAAAGHPILAKAIEITVNRARNRFTQVDLDAFYCPSPNLSVLRFDKARHVAGSCVLGAAANIVLDRPTQHAFQAGEIIPKTTSTFPIPGKILLLQQNGEDMGGNRFTNTAKNLMVAVADVRKDDLPLDIIEDERVAIEPVEEKPEIGGRFELEALYSDDERAYQDIRIEIVM
jgi:hypothetical protein